MSELILVIGGCRSGKSTFAVALARRLELPTMFLAPCLPGTDIEMLDRIEGHRAQRPAEWPVREEGYELATLLAQVDKPVVVLDCVPTWLGNLLVRGDPDFEIEAACAELRRAILACPARLVLCVTAEVGAGLVPETALGRRFRDRVGIANKLLAAAASRVYRLVAGLAVELKQQAADVDAIAGDIRRRLG